MFKLFKVRGQSMAPTLLTGDIVLLIRRRARVGEIVVIDHAKYGMILKRINTDRQLSGDGPLSTTTEDLGAYDPSTLFGVAILAITQTGLRRL